MSKPRVRFTTDVAFTQIRNRKFTEGKVMLIKTAAFMALTATLVSTGAVQAQSWKRIKSEADFTAAMVGKVFLWGEGNAGTATLDANGTTKGKLPDGRTYAGNWVWNKNRYCRNIKISDGNETGTSCAKVEKAGDQVRLRFKGRDVVLSEQ